MGPSNTTRTADSTVETTRLAAVQGEVMSRIRSVFMATVLMMLPFVALAQSNPTKTIKDADIPIGSSITFSADTTYILDGFVFVDTMATLTIEPGTVIKSKETPTTNDPTSALIVTRGAKIMADGTPTRPIIFTTDQDDVDNVNDIPLDGDLGRGLWGGIIILGKASINVANGVNNIEGIDATTEPRGIYGGGSSPDDDDDSGILRFVSIRHGGFTIGSDNELNGLSMGGVGRGTTIEFVEVFFNKDDGFEWFGGTVNTRYLVAAFCGDDAFDYDEGVRGQHQFWFAIQSGNQGDHGGEHDGGTEPEDGTPFAAPVIVNATYIGTGTGGTGSKPNNTFTFRDNAGGKYFNSVFHDFKGRLLSVEQVDTAPLVEDSERRWRLGDFEFKNNIAGSFGAGNTAEALGDSVGDIVLANPDNGIRIVDPQLAGISRTTDGGLDPRPTAGSPALDPTQVYRIPLNLSPIHLPIATKATESNLYRSPGDGFLVQTDYTGAFSKDDLWISGWTALTQHGYTRGVISGRPTRTIVDADIPIGSNVLFSADTTYILDGFVFVDTTATLTIEAGTVVKNKQTPTGSDPTSALIVTRGAKIFAEGTPTNPIIFTSDQDDVDDVTDIPLDSDLGRGLWGGIIILGKASINVANGVNNIEGIDATTEPRGLYGGGTTPDDDDNSGVLRFVSIRHGGFTIGSDNELNGLSMGGVGRGTTIEYVEVFFNKDDGFEWFGGTVNTRYLISAFCGDDSYDYDEGVRGYHQFWFAIQSGNQGDHGGEHDGGTEPEDGAPFAKPMILNATYIGTGTGGTGSKANNTFTFRDNAGGKYFNSIFHDYKGRLLSVEQVDSDTTVQDSERRWAKGDLQFKHNIVGTFGAGNTAATLGDSIGAIILNDTENKNRITDPLLRNISRSRSWSLDPRPSEASPAWVDSLLWPEPRDIPFFRDVDFAGAFGSENWAADWTALSQMGYLSTSGAGLPIFSESGQTLPKQEQVDSDTATVSFALSSGGTTDVRFTLGTVSGSSVTFQDRGTTRPDEISSDPPVSGGNPVLFFEIETSIPDSVSFEATVTINYTDEQLVAAGVAEEDSLVLFRYDAGADLWIELPTTIDATNNIATATTTAFSNWSLGPAAATGITDESVVNNAPIDFSLAQNAPNPFNPATQISFTVPVTSKIRLVIYNLLGQQVETLIDGMRSAGSYTVTWDAGRVPSGVYFYRIESRTDGGISQILTKKMTLLK